MLMSLEAQTKQEFEVIIIEDGSTLKSDHLVDQFDFNITYHFKENTGPGDSRNVGMSLSKGDYLLFFDSDCVLPTDYIEKLSGQMESLRPDAFGGPDAAHDSFSDVQKAINYSMTSFFTTGGIRGGKKQLDKYQPRSFNMGISREVYESVGGFSDVHPGEDPDLSFRIMNAGFKIVLIREAFVYHKRRIDFYKFIQQVYKFGVVRVMLNKWYPNTGKLVYVLPSAFLIGVAGLITFSFLVSAAFLIPIVAYACLIFIDAMRKNTIYVALKAIPASFFQLMGYGFGYLKSLVLINLLSKNERQAFPSFFFGKNKP